VRWALTVGLVCVSCGPFVLPSPPPTETTEERGCVESCEQMHNLCANKREGGRIEGSDVVSALFVLPAGYFTFRRCKNELAACYGGCSHHGL
jgi:hypothetical protein